MDWAGLELRPLRGGAEENLEGAGGNKVRERRMSGVGCPGVLREEGPRAGGFWDRP